ncbi:MAG: PAS domain S-box protein [Balneolaceae bacterium]
MIQTLVIGADDDIQSILKEALEKRGHSIFELSSSKDLISAIETHNISLVVLSDINPSTLECSRMIRDRHAGRRTAIVAILRNDAPHKLDEILDSGIDQCIIESIYDEKRLHFRLAFAEKLAKDKFQQALTERQLRESEAKAHSILNTTVDAIITINAKGIVRSFNKTAEELFGYDSSEVIGKNVHMLMPEPYRSEHDDYMEHYKTTGERKIIGIGREVTGRRKDGSTFPMYLAVSEVKLPDSHIFTGIVRDISEQRRLEQEVLRISEHERRRIGQDLHDGLGQMLTGIGLIAKNFVRRLEKETHSETDTAVEITKLIREADEYARGLARGLIPVEFDKGGLRAALERLQTNAMKLFRIELRLEIGGEPEFDDATQAIHLYRIAQEAVSNAVKHGRASKVTIHLAATGQHIRLRVTDNGRGFDEQWDKEGGLGVRIMQFRARLIGGNLEISNLKNEGAVITCTVPLHS